MVKKRAFWFVSAGNFVGISAFGVYGLIISICFFSGIILISNGFIGIYVAKIFYQVKGRPKYIFKNIIE